MKQTTGLQCGKDWQSVKCPRFCGTTCVRHLKHLFICATLFPCYAGIGGPVIDCDGNFVGMDFYGRKETPYLPRDIIMKLLSYFDGKGHVLYVYM